jgi:anaerobic glycerol-3-phosphate dehydrogenase
MMSTSWTAVGLAGGALLIGIGVAGCSSGSSVPDTSPSTDSVSGGQSLATVCPKLVDEYAKLPTGQAVTDQQIMDFVAKVTLLKAQLPQSEQHWVADYANAYQQYADASTPEAISKAEVARDKATQALESACTAAAKAAFGSPTATPATTPTASQSPTPTKSSSKAASKSPSSTKSSSKSPSSTKSPSSSKSP